MESPGSSVYTCRRMRGNGSASFYLSPLFDAWAADAGLRLAPGTLNLCADRSVEVPEMCIPLSPWDYALLLPARKAQPGYDPRLYLVVINGTIRAWLFRWSATAHMHHFVGDLTGCPRPRNCEVVAETNLTEALGLTVSS